MSILPPPYIEPRLPAQYAIEKQDSRKIKIIFSLNRAMGAIGVLKDSIIQAKIKTFSSNQVLGIVKNESIEKFSSNENDDRYIAYFPISNISLEPGSYYKIQLAFLDGEEVGRYSQPGIFKFTFYPILSILGKENQELIDYKINSNQFIGKYETQDYSEKVMEYRFIIRDEDENIFEDTGYQVHNAMKDTSYNISTDNYAMKKEIQPLKNYYLTYRVKTSNGLEIESKKYWMRANNNITIPFPGVLKLQENKDEGYFSCQIFFSENRILSGSYILMRSDEYSDYKEWTPLFYFNYSNKMINKKQRVELYRDYTVAHGVKYHYAIQQYAEGFAAKRIPCNILIDQNGREKQVSYFSLYFEDLFLFDGKKQLKIRFNPKVTNFKDIIMENKIDTLGNKFPFFFRNGRLKYKNFSLEGLITCNMDSQHSFSIEEVPNINLTQDNIHTELDFKLKVMEWLNNGTTKLFRSPAEGNYIIQLTKINLTPIDKLGRMLHSFKAEAFEIAEYNYNNLLKFNIYNNSLYLSQDIFHEIYNLPEEGETIQIPEAIDARIVNSTFGTRLIFELRNHNRYKIIIGHTKYYQIHIEKGNPLISITVENKEKYDHSQIEFSYQEKNAYKNITNSNNQIIINTSSYDQIEQMIGPIDIISKIKNDNNNNNKNLNIQIESIPYLRIQSRPTENGWYDETTGQFFNDSYFSKEISPKMLPFYYDCKNKQWYIYDGTKYILQEEENISKLYSITFKKDQDLITEEYFLESNYIEINFEELKIENIQIGSGLYCDIFYYGSSYELKDDEKI